MPTSAMGKGALDDYKEDEICDTVRNIRTGHIILICVSCFHTPPLQLMFTIASPPTPQHLASFFVYVILSHF